MIDDLRNLEPMLREAIIARLQRGKVECRLSFGKKTATSSVLAVNDTVLLALTSAQQQVLKTFPEAPPLSVNELLRWPGVLAADTLPAEALREACMALVASALLPALVAVLFSASTRLSVGPTALTAMLVSASLTGEPPAFSMELPPLRKRVEDIPLLAEHFLGRFARQLGRPVPRLTLANVQELQRYQWPGNVRELQHALERACIVATDGRLRFELSKDHLRRSESGKEATPTERILTELEIRELEANNIRAALAASRGKIYGMDGAAEKLGMKPTTLASRIKALGIRQ